MNLKQLVFNKLLPEIYKFYLSINTKQYPLDIKETEKALVIAPHADDESLGVGGTLAKYPKNFDVICLTDGAKGLKSLPYDEAKKVREEEFLNAMKIAGVNSAKVIGIPDRDVIAGYYKLETLDISEYDYIFIPNLIDTHKDHKSVAILVKKMLKNKQHKANIQIVFYEVWSTLALPNRFIDISTTAEIKAKMLEAHKSQMALRNYLPASMGLSEYRALMPNVKNAEAFLALDEKTFVNLVKKIYI
ncbi:MAG: PIG-L deacetylase family protein [Candidatus Gastranaerophilaceae bacterium]